MKYFQFYLIVLFSVLVLESNAQLTVSGYTNHDIVGFDVLVEDNAVIMDSALTDSALSLLEAKLTEITTFNIDAVKMDSLKAVPIFVDWSTTTGAAQYHPSEAWLINNGYAPEKAKCVEISNVTNFINWTNQNQPYMILHELAHAYHHRVLNFNNSVITNAFNHAISSNLYTNISYHNGGGNYSTAASAYGLNNEKEFFAELTEAYFGLNDYFPFDYNDLKAYDSIGFNAVFTIWGDITSSIMPEVFESEVSVYPNPTKGLITVDLGDGENRIKLNKIVDSAGREINPSLRKDGHRFIRINIENEAHGIYFIHWEEGEKRKVFKVVKM